LEVKGRKVTFDLQIKEFNETHMIKISSFYPFAGLLSVTQEFHEEKAFVKMKSLTYEHDSEFDYKDVGGISDGFYANSSQCNFGFWLLLVMGFILSVFCNSLYANPILLRIGQILYVCGLLLYITGFKKSWWIYISDRHDNTLTYVKLTRKNHDLMLQVIETIKNGSGNMQEITAADPFPAKTPAFEHVYYDIPKMKKITDRFYENEIIGFEKGIFLESVYNIKYSQLSGKFDQAKWGSDILEFSFSITLPIIATIGGFNYGFGIELGIPFPPSLRYLQATLFVLSLMSWPLGFLKREVIRFYGKDENIAYWTYVNRNNKEKVEEIIRFVQSKISPVTDNELLKEQE
jgi:hypothetical protein